MIPAADAMNDWRYLASPSSAARCWRSASSSSMFVIYIVEPSAPGFTANVVQTAANKGVLLAFVAMAQTLVVITAGIDLSVGMIFILTNCLASWLVVGTPAETALGVIAVLAAACCAARSTAPS